jgi:hypothetical protein
MRNLNPIRVGGVNLMHIACACREHSACRGLATMHRLTFSACALECMIHVGPMAFACARHDACRGMRECSDEGKVKVQL